MASKAPAKKGAAMPAPPFAKKAAAGAKAPAKKAAKPFPPKKK